VLVQVLHLVGHTNSTVAGEGEVIKPLEFTVAKRGDNTCYAKIICNLDNNIHVFVPYLLAILCLLPLLLSVFGFSFRSVYLDSTLWVTLKYDPLKTGLHKVVITLSGYNNLHSCNEWCVKALGYTTDGLS